MWQGFSHLNIFLHYLVLAKLATSSIRVNLCTTGNVERAVFNIYQLSSMQIFHQGRVRHKY